MSFQLSISDCRIHCVNAANFKDAFFRCKCPGLSVFNDDTAAQFLPSIEPNMFREIFADVKTLDVTKMSIESAVAVVNKLLAVNGGQLK